MNKQFFKLSFNNLKNRKLRSGLTLLGIVISVMVIFVLISLSLGLQNGIEQQFERMGRDKIFIYPTGIPGVASASSLTLDDVDAIEKVNGVKLSFYATINTAEVSWKDKTRYLFTMGVPNDNKEVINLVQESFTIEVKDGNFFQKGESNKIVLGYKIPEVFPGIGIGDKLSLNDKKYRVIGILETLGNDGDDKSLYISYDDSKELFGNGNNLDYLGIQIDDVDDMKKITSRIESKLDKLRDVDEETRDYVIQTPEDLLESFNSILSILTVFLVGIGGISIFVGAVGIANTMYTSVVERTKEIGIMKAIGAKNSSISIIFLIESGLLGLIGGLTGMMVGFGVSELVGFLALKLAGTTYLQPVYPISMLVSLIFFSILIGIVSGILPSKNASKTNIVDALRYE